MGVTVAMVTADSVRGRRGGASRPRRPGPARRAGPATGPWPGSTASGSTSSHGRSTVARSGVPGCGRSSSGSVADGTSVRRSRRRRPGSAAPSGSRGRVPRVCSSACPRRSQPHASVSGVVDDQHGVEEVVLVDPAPRGRLVDRRRRRRARSANPATAARRWASRSPRFEPRERTARVMPGRSGGRAGGGVRVRWTTTATSANVQRDRRLRLVQGDLDGAAPAGRSARRRRCGRRRSRSGRRRAGDDRGGALGELAVVQGVGEVVGCGGRARGRATRVTSTTKSCPSRRSCSNTPWWPRTRRPRSAMRSPVTARPAARPGAAPRRRRAELQRRATATASIDAATSCTRTPHAPAAAASAEIAAVAASRPSGGRGAPSSSASSAPRNRLREAPTSTGKPERHAARPARRSSAQLCAAVFAKPRPGSSTIAARSTPASTAASTRASSSARTSRDHVVVRRERVHPVAVAAPVHEDPRHPGLRDDRGHRRVGQTAGHVVDDRRAGLERRLGDRGAGGVDADRHALGDQVARSPAAPGAAPRRRRSGRRPAGWTRRRRRRCPHRPRASRARARRRRRGRGSGRRRRRSRA